MFDIKAIGEVVNKLTNRFLLCFAAKYTYLFSGS